MQPPRDFLSLPTELVSAIIDHLSLKRIIRMSLSSKTTKQILRQSLLTFHLKLSNFDRPCEPQLRSAFMFVANASVHQLQRISFYGQSGVIGTFENACFDLLQRLILQQDQLVHLSISLPYALIPNSTNFWTQLALSPKISSLTYLCVSTRDGAKDLPIILPVLANLQHLIINDHVSDAKEIVNILPSATPRLKMICLPPRTKPKMLQPLSKLPELQTILLSDQLEFFHEACKNPTEQSLFCWIDRIEKRLPPKLATSILFGGSPYTQGFTTYSSLVNVAIFRREINVLRRLITEGAQIGRSGEPSLNYWRMTPLETAIFFDRVDCIEVLLEAGAAVSLAAPRKFSFAFQVIRRGSALCTEFGFEFLLKHHSKDLPILLIDVATLDTIFHVAARANERLLELALEKFLSVVDINAENAAGWPAIALAPSLEALENLLRHGAEPNPLLKARGCSLFQAMMTNKETSKQIPHLVCLLQSSAKKRIQLTPMEIESILSTTNDKLEPYWLQSIRLCLQILEFCFESVDSTEALQALLDRAKVWQWLQSDKLLASDKFLFYAMVCKHCKLPAAMLDHVVAVLKVLGTKSSVGKSQTHLRDLFAHWPEIVNPSLIRLAAEVAPTQSKKPSDFQTLLSWINELIESDAVSQQALTASLLEIASKAKLGDPDLIFMLAKLVSRGASTLLEDQNITIMLIIAQRGFPNALLHLLRHVDPKLLHVAFVTPEDEGGQSLLRFANQKLAQRVFGWRTELVDEIRKHCDPSD